MTDRASRSVRATGLLTAACVLCAGCSLLQPRAARPAPAGHPAPAHAGSPASRRQAPAPQLSVILPVSPARLQAAAALAGQFAAAYDTWSWQQAPAAWLAGLRPTTTSGLYAALTQAATIPGILAERDHARQSATATTTAAKDP